MMDRANLKPGAFYWVRPVFDVDFDPPGFEGKEIYDVAFHDASYGHWTQNEQPARFEGYGEDGSEHWLYIGQDESEGWWPTCWVGEEIRR